MNLLIIGSRNQPIPPVKGGAVENLVKMFYETNETRGDMLLSIISCRDEALDLENIHYTKSSFYTVEKGKNYSKVSQFLLIAINKFFKFSWVRQSKFATNVVRLIEEKNIQFDAILVENYIDIILPLAKAFPNKKIYFHLHNDKLNNSILNGKKIVNACEKIITVSDYIKNRVNTIPGAKEKTVSVINSICIDRFGTKESNHEGLKLRKKYEIVEDEVLIVFAGRVAKTKGVLELVRAFSNINNVKIKLMIVGNSWYGKGTPKDRYMRELKEIGESVKDRIIFTGYVDYEKMQNYYSMADIIVIPSIWQEPCSLTLFEAMASKVPLITTKTGGTPEVVKDYAKVLTVDAFFVDSLQNAIEELSIDKNKREKMAKEAFEYVQQYDPNRYYDNMTSIMKEEKNDE